MFEGFQLINLLSIGAFIAVIVLAITLVYKIERIQELQTSAIRLKKSLDEMDEQAKLIVRTDMELNKTQEELDKKITGLYALQKLSRSISTTLEENQIFKMIKEEQLRELGFEKALGFLWLQEKNEFSLELNIGYTREESMALSSFIEEQKTSFLGLIKNGSTLSSIDKEEGSSLREKIKGEFKTHSFVIPPVLAQEGNKGFLFFGTDSPDVAITEGDKELIVILANQLGQALENARLFEKTWLAHQELEKKVEERTRELSRALEEVKVISKRKTDFISAVSHELRTPLTSVKGYASILLAGKLGDIPVEVKERLEKINRHSDELVHMVNDLLDIARIESGKMTMKKEELDLKNVIEAVSDLLSVQFKERKINFDYDIAEGANTILADRSQISRVFINLIGNALKFTPADGKISVRAYKSDGSIQVDVTDTGCGIPDNAKEAVFEEFFRVDNLINQEAKGTGLGLSLVKHIVEAHNGRIWVKSKLGQGSTFSFTISKT